MTIDYSVHEQCVKLIKMVLVLKLGIALVIYGCLVQNALTTGVEYDSCGKPVMFTRCNCIIEYHC